MNGLVWIAPVVGIAALVVAYVLASWIGKQSTGNERMTEIAGFIHEGSMAFLKREYRTMIIVVAVLFVIEVVDVLLVLSLLGVVAGEVELVVLVIEPVVEVVIVCHLLAFR